MTATTAAVVLVLISAAMHATWNLLLKLAGDKLIMAWGIRFGSMFLAVPVVVISPPSPEAILFVVLSGILHTVYDLCLVTAYRLGDYSQVYTYARGMSPALAALIAFLVLGENLSALAIAGLFTTVVGLLLVSGSLRGMVSADRRATTWAIITAFVIASYSVLDAAGVRIEGSAPTYVGSIFVVNFALLTPITLWRRWRHPDWQLLWREAGRTATASALQITSYAFVVFALSVSAVGYVTSLREIGVVFAALLGWAVLKEPYGVLRVSGTLAVVAGIIVLSLETLG